MALFNLVFNAKVKAIMGDYDGRRKEPKFARSFLNNVRKSHAAVTVFLVNGVKLQGVITWFDNFSILLKRDQHVQLVYKHAISTIMPVGPIQLQEFDDKDTGSDGE